MKLKEREVANVWREVFENYRQDNEDLKKENERLSKEIDKLNNQSYETAQSQLMVVNPERFLAVKNTGSSYVKISKVPKFPFRKR